MVPKTFRWLGAILLTHWSYCSPALSHRFICDLRCVFSVIYNWIMFLNVTAEHLKQRMMMLYRLMSKGTKHQGLQITLVGVSHCTICHQIRCPRWDVLHENNPVHISNIWKTYFKSVIGGEFCLRHWWILFRFMTFIGFKQIRTYVKETQNQMKTSIIPHFTSLTWQLTGKTYL